MALADQTLVQVRIDKDLRDEVARIYEELGLDIPTAIRMFLRRSILEQGLPFNTTLPKKKISRTDALKAFEELRAQASSVPEMTLDEINREISATRAQRKAD